MRLIGVLGTWPFALGLAVLLANDWWLKAAHPGVVAGKLSDVAGMYVVALLLLATWPHHAVRVHAGLSAAFLWWKSPLSEPAIGLFNALAPVSVGRTVDYTDLVALVALVGCAPVVRNVAAYTMSWPADRRAVLAPMILLTAFAITGTSVIPTRQQYRVRPTAGAPALDRAAVADVIAAVAREHRLACVDCTARTEGATYDGRGITLRYTTSESAVAFDVAAYPSMPLFGSGGRARAEAVRRSLKAALAARFQGLELVETLDAAAGRRR